MDALSGVLHGSVLGLIMFVIFINNLQDVIQVYCKLYVDGSKIIRVINPESSVKSLERNIDSVNNWTRLIKLNSSKLQVDEFW